MSPRPPGTGLQVTRVGAEATDDVLSVVRAAFADRPALDPPADALAETEETLARRLGIGRGLLATLDGRPVGAVVLDPIDDVLYLRRFGVLPGVQGQGVAQALIDAAVRAGPAQQRLGVAARVELPRTVEFWRRRGFTDAGGRPPYLRLHRPLPTRHRVVDGAQMRDLGRRVGALLEPGDLVVLTGGLGAGKTTFTQGLGQGLRVRGDVTSPTFVIARVHPSLVAGAELVHVDAYRLGGVAELDDLDLDTSLDDAVTVVEWGEGLAEGLSERRLIIRITRAEGLRPVSGDEGRDGGRDDVEDPRDVEMRWLTQ